MTDEANALLDLANTSDEELLSLLTRELNFYTEVLHTRGGRTILTPQDLREIFHRMWDVAHISKPTPPEPELHPEDIPQSLKQYLPRTPDLQKLETELGEVSKGFLGMVTGNRRRI